MKDKMQEKLSIGKALSYIVLSAALIWGGIYGFFAIQRWKVLSKQTSSEYNIVAILQTSKGKEILQTRYLAELLELSQDIPCNFFSIDSEWCKQKLLACPVFKEASVELIEPSILHVDYLLRVPQVLVKDYKNAALDNEGVFIPVAPFFSEKRLVEVYLGLQEKGQIAWGTKIDCPELTLARNLQKVFMQKKDTFSTLALIDTHNAYASSSGRREIVVGIGQNKDTFQYLRLNTSSWEKGVILFFKLLPVLQKEKEKKVSGKIQEIIDLRTEGIVLVTHLTYPHYEQEQSLSQRGIWLWSLTPDHHQKSLVTYAKMASRFSCISQVTHKEVEEKERV